MVLELLCCCLEAPPPLAPEATTMLPPCSATMLRCCQLRCCCGGPCCSPAQPCPCPGAPWPAPPPPACPEGVPAPSCCSPDPCAPASSPEPCAPASLAPTLYFCRWLLMWKMVRPAGQVEWVGAGTEGWLCMAGAGGGWVGWGGGWAQEWYMQALPATTTEEWYMQASFSANLSSKCAASVLHVQLQCTACGASVVVAGSAFKCSLTWCSCTNAVLPCSYSARQCSARGPT
jgi:hypothetical protein